MDARSRNSEDDDIDIPKVKRNYARWVAGWDCHLARWLWRSHDEKDFRF